MNTDEKNRYISEQMGWKVVKEGRDGSMHYVIWELPNGKTAAIKDHLSNAFAYVVPYWRKNGLSSLVVDYLENVVIANTDKGPVFIYGLEAEDQAICDAFIEYMKERKS